MISQGFSLHRHIGIVYNVVHSNLCETSVKRFSTAPVSTIHSSMWIVFEPILFFLLQKEKKAGHAKPEALPVPHAILLMALISLPANTAKAKTSIRRKSRARLWSMEGPGNHSKGSPVVSFLFLLEPKGDPAQRSAFGKEEGGCEYGAFAAPAEAEWSWLLLTPRRTRS